jgi:hypothetical protein
MRDVTNQDGAARDATPALTRRSLLRGAGAAAGMLAVGGPRALALSQSQVPTLASAPVTATGRLRSFHSLPDVRPPATAVTGEGTAPGLLFVGPETDGHRFRTGPLIIDQSGEPIYFNPVPGKRWATNFRVHRYRGKPALSWWQGYVIPPGFGDGEGVVVDSSYRELARIRAGNGRTIDLHELLLTPQGTALFTCQPLIVPADMSSVGGPRDGHVYESIMQEVDIRSGRLLLEWRSLEHIPISESYLPRADPYDYLHLNSIDIAPDGNLLVSGRHTWAVYKLERRTGRVIWRLGGKRSDFRVGRQAHFCWQHDAQYPSGGRITLFDNGSDGYTNTERQSRALLLDVNTRDRTVHLARSYEHPNPLLAPAMGSAQPLQDGHLLVGWGSLPRLTEFAPDGGVLSEVHLPVGRETYRGFRFGWEAVPSEPPALASRRDQRTGLLTLYVSWNGATGVASWLISAGGKATKLRPFGVAARQAFETAIQLGTVDGGYVAATALDHNGAALGRSRPFRV